MSSKWEKVLYKKQDYPDNYIDPSHFLKDLQRNLNTPIYTVTELINASQLIIRPFTLVILFISLYFYLSNGWTHPLVLFGTSTSITCILAFTYTQDAVHGFLKPSIFLHLFLCGVAPILCTLTQSISSDTLWAMTVAMLIFHLMFYSYKPQQALIYNAISLNAAVFAAVCLASLMDTALEGFVLVSLSFQIFAFSPKLTKYFLGTNIILVGTTLILLATISVMAAVAFFIVVLVILIVFPLWLHSLQGYKNNIYGPWDEAIIQR